MEQRCIEDIAAELSGISSSLKCLTLFVKPNDSLPLDIPSRMTIEGAFYAIEQQLERIADNLIDFADWNIKTTTPTDESKDCR